jgi:hypothetical protein
MGGLWPLIFAVFWAFLEGVVQYAGCCVWFFCGENVVECVVKLVRCRSLFKDEKCATFGKYFFGSPRRGDG